MDLWSEDSDMTTQELTPREITRELRRLSGAVDRVTKCLFGNGDEGMDETLRKLKVAVEKLEGLPDTVDNLSRSFEAYKTERLLTLAESKPKTNLSSSDRLLQWFGDKVLPSLVTGFITTIITIIAILAVIHYTEIFK